MDKTVFKKELIDTCRGELELKNDELSKELKSLRESAESDTKSSMGDKYETGREMIMQERTKLEDQRSIILKHLSFLSTIEKEKKYEKVEFGAYLEAGQTCYLICAPIGKMEVNGKVVFVISANSPIAQSMLGKKAGDSFTFNKTTSNIDLIA